MGLGMTADLISERELRDVDLVARVEIAQKVGRLLSRTPVENDRELLLQLARILVEDVSVSVREALAKELKQCSFLPQDIIERVTQDIDQVATPFLIASAAISDAFLEKIARQCSETAQEAIASREYLAEVVAYAISDVGTVSAVETLVRNETAEMSERIAGRVVDRFPEVQSLMEAMASRADLPASIIDRIIFKISRQYAEHLVKSFNLSTDYASYLTSLAHRSVFAQALEKSTSEEIDSYLHQLKDIEELNADILLSYIQKGHIRLFAAAIAVLLDRDLEEILPPIKSGHVHLMTEWLGRAGLSRPMVKTLREAYTLYLQRR